MWAFVVLSDVLVDPTYTEAHLTATHFWAKVLIYPKDIFGITNRQFPGFFLQPSPRVGENATLLNKTSGVG
jgi:hypothetical protein